jgi:hypothetical protein
LIFFPLGGFNRAWPLIRQCRVTATFRRADGRTLHVRKATRAEPAQLAIIRRWAAIPAREGYKKCLSEPSGFTEFYECSATDRFFPL